MEVWFLQTECEWQDESYLSPPAFPGKGEHRAGWPAIAVDATRWCCEKRLNMGILNPLTDWVFYVVTSVDDHIRSWETCQVKLWVPQKLKPQRNRSAEKTEERDKYLRCSIHTSLCHAELFKVATSECVHACVRTLLLFQETWHFLLGKNWDKAKY